MAANTRATRSPTRAISVVVTSALNFGIAVMEVLLESLVKQKDGPRMRERRRAWLTSQELCREKAVDSGSSKGRRTAVFVTRDQWIIAIGSRGLIFERNVRSWKKGAAHECERRRVEHPVRHFNAPNEH